MTGTAAQKEPGRKVGRQVSLAEFARLWASDMTVGEIAEQLGISRAAVQFRARRRGLPPRRRVVTLSPRPPREAFARMWLAGVRLADIAAHFGISYGLAQDLLGEFDLPRRPVGGQRRCNRKSLADYLAAELRLAMAETAQVEVLQLHLAEMVDRPASVGRAA